MAKLQSTRLLNTQYKLYVSILKGFGRARLCLALQIGLTRHISRTVVQCTGLTVRVLLIRPGV